MNGTTQMVASVAELTAPSEMTIERPLLPKARALLHEWVESESLRKHCEAVSACLRYFARRDGADEDLWGAVGLLHDMDFEKHPNLELAADGHPFVGVASLRDQGWGRPSAAPSSATPTTVASCRNRHWRRPSAPSTS